MRSTLERFWSWFLIWRIRQKPFTSGGKWWNKWKSDQSFDPKPWSLSLFVPPLFTAREWFSSDSPYHKLPLKPFQSATSRNYVRLIFVNIKSTDDILDDKIRGDSEAIQEETTAEDDSRVPEETEEVGPKKKRAKKENKKTEKEDVKDTEEVVVPLRKKPRISDEDAAARLASLADQIKNNIRAGDEAKDEEPKKKKQKPLKVSLLGFLTIG